MIGFKLNDIKGMFFDTKAVQSAVDVGARAVLSKFGAFVRTSARTSIRKRKATSKEGSPPSSHAGFLRRGIFFGYDAAAKSVVVGPVRLNKGTAPATLEHGGQATITRRSDSAFGPWRRGRKRTFVVAIAPRPYMNPALERELPKLPALWRNAISK